MTSPKSASCAGPATTGCWPAWPAASPWYLDVDVTLVRVIIAALALLTGAGAPLYVAAWLLLPADGEDQSIAAAWLAARRNRVPGSSS